ncbi:uncharacterized protein [Panulirus ornatus]|uniref:uncharacterized protein n=1 Tax=Panulirus ornatus TaxID=150431 RepID=UPI003A866B45
MVLQFQKDRVASSDTVAWYKGQLDPDRKLLSVTLCARFFLFTIHGWATFFVLSNAQGEVSILEGDVWVERVRPVLARNWNFQILKDKLWLYRWHHLCFTYDHQRHLISTYVDGRLNNHQEYDVGRHMSGDRAKLGQGAEIQRSLSGDLTQVNVWDTALSQEEIQAIAQCRSDPQGNYVSWEVGWTLTNVTSRDVPLADLCRQKVDLTYFWFPSAPYDTAQYLCRALGTHLTSTKAELLAILNVSSVTFTREDSCYTDIWVAMNDIDEEGVWKINGLPVTGEISWAPQEPNGLHYENCASGVLTGMADVDCHANLKCVVCPMNDQTRFSFLGTCETELRNVYFTAFQHSPSEVVFVGYGAYHIKRQEGIWTWVNVVNNRTIAQLGESVPDFPMGRRWWHLQEPVCGQKPGGRRLLLLSPCGTDQFTCDDATCIPLDNRCDLKYDCRDNTDELECHTVAFPRDYQDHLPPRASGIDQKSLPIIVTINIESLSVQTMEMTMEVSYRLELTWLDNRLQYQNLKVENTLNILPASTVDRLWTPQVDFINTIGNHHTLMDVDTIMLVTRLADSIGRNITAPAEVEVFSGETNTMTTRRKYGTVFMCDLDLALYPFDAQECFMHLMITSATKSFLEFDTIISSVNNTASNLLLEYNVGELVLEHGRSGSGMFSEVWVRVPLTRRYGYAILNIYIPTLVLLVVSYVTLFIRPDVFDVRMMAALTVQLVIATLFSQVSGSLPKTSYYKMVDVWLIFCISATFLTIIFHVIVDNILFWREGVIQPLNGSSVAQSNTWVEPENKEKSTIVGGNRWRGSEWLQQRVVVATKVMVAAVFILFNICYWAYILAQ